MLASDLMFCRVRSFHAKQNIDKGLPLLSWRLSSDDQVSMMRSTINFFKGSPGIKDPVLKYHPKSEPRNAHKLGVPCIEKI